LKPIELIASVLAAGLSREDEPIRKTTRHARIATIESAAIDATFHRVDIVSDLFSASGPSAIRV
jgi:hypothetical protein